MGAQAPHPRPQAAAVYPGLAAADESVVLAAGHWAAREKYRARARDSLSAAGLDFQWAVAGPLVGQGDELPERQAQRRPAALQKVAWLEPQPLVEAARPRAAEVQEQAPGEWVSALPRVPQASRRQDYLPAQAPVPWGQFSDSQGLLPPGQGSREWQGPPVWARVGQVRWEQSAWQRLDRLGGLAGEAPLRLASYGQLLRRLPWLLSPPSRQLLPGLPLPRPLEFSFVLFPQRRPESNWSASFFPRRRNRAEDQ